MDDAAGRTAATAPGTAADREALEALIFDWGDAYVIGRDEQGGWYAARRDRVGTLLTAATAGELRTLIRADYTASPVPRELPAGDASS